MTARVIPLRVGLEPEPTSRQLADRLLSWHADLHAELDRNDCSAEDFERRANDQAEAARLAATEAVEWMNREPAIYFALMGISARYMVSARVFLARSRELGSTSITSLQNKAPS